MGRWFNHLCWALQMAPRTALGISDIRAAKLGHWPYHTPVPVCAWKIEISSARPADPIQAPALPRRPSITRACPVAPAALPPWPDAPQRRVRKPTESRRRRGAELTVRSRRHVPENAVRSRHSFPAAYRFLCWLRCLASRGPPSRLRSHVRLLRTRLGRGESVRQRALSTAATPHPLPVSLSRRTARGAQHTRNASETRCAVLDMIPAQPPP